MREFINVVACYSLVIGTYVFGALQTEAAFGQCYGGSCYAGSCYTGGYSYAPTYSRYGSRYAYSGGYSAGRSCYGGYCSNGSCSRSCSRGTIAGRVPGEYAPGLTCANGSCQLQTCAPCAPSASVPQAASDAFDAACKCDDCKCDDCKCGEETETIETEETTEPVKPCGPVNVRICSDGSCKLGNLIKTPIATTYLAAANAVRALRGLPPLALDPSLESGSQQHAYSMARYGGL
ncbi:MAG: hypothetical protein IJM30_11950, partial [Thermoguttaceae bacterium]|nr:hypothetical protein [Thermoguttaceae bacterium]